MPIILTDRDTPRLRYAADLLFNRFAGLPCIVTTDPSVWAASPLPGILYAHRASDFPSGAYVIEPSGLLAEEGVSGKPMPEGSEAGHPILFASDTGDHPFDVFSAAFYLVTRYEEHLPHRKDVYGRYDHRQSAAFRLGFLDRPIVESWTLDLLEAVYSKAGVQAPAVRPFTFSSTCDVDIAYSSRHKGLMRNLGSALRSLATGRFGSLARQLRVLLGNEEDPYDSYEWMEACHRELALSCRYFILFSSRYGGYDRNLDPGSPAMVSLVRRLAVSGGLGLHPSWGSGDRSGLLALEKERLESISGLVITHSRQHYLRFTLPDTYRLLLSQGVTDDHSMGYGTVNGYRASISFPHPWYDLGREKATGLTVHPFCFMDATAHHEEGLDPEEGLKRLRRHMDLARSTGGTLSTVWHNSVLGTDPMYEGWRDVYLRFLTEVRASMPDPDAVSGA
jgi:hypothetical protein